MSSVRKGVMLRGMNLRRIALSLLPLAAIACSSSSNDPAPVSPSDAGVAKDAASSDGGVTAKLSFKPSNVDLSGIDVSSVGDWVVAEKNCQIMTDSNLVSCGDGSKLAYALVTQSDSSKVAVYVARSVRIEQNGELLPQGPYPLVLVALDTEEKKRGAKAKRQAAARSMLATPSRCVPPQLPARAPTQPSSSWSTPRKNR